MLWGSSIYFKGYFQDVLPNLDDGECIVIDDSINLPTKIILDKLKEELKSSTIDFWDRWYDGKIPYLI